MIYCAKYKIQYGPACNELLLAFTVAACFAFGSGLKYTCDLPHILYDTLIKVKAL